MTITVGYFVHNNENITQSLKSTLENGFEFAVSPITHPRFGNFAPYTDVFLRGPDRSKLVIYVPKRNYTIRKNVLLLEKEFNYASHIGINNLIIECPDEKASIKNMADVLNRRFISVSEHFNEHQAPSVSIQIPVVSWRKQVATWRSDSDEISEDDSWNKWNLIRMISQSHPKLFVALEIGPELPEGERLQRWLGEPLAMIILPTSVFLTNASQFPVLSKAHQHFLGKVNFSMAQNFCFIIKGNNMHGHIKHYSQYLNHLKSTELFSDKFSKFFRDYEDLLQLPLQPLKDDLGSLVYEVFETDNIKYQQYELAIYTAMKTLKKEEIIAMVVGAGRGPLVEKTLKAASDANKKVKIYALEKNSNAMVTLDVLRDLKWGGAQGLVEIVQSDMRSWDAPVKADLVISELLGSFADNELSPECLDGVWKYSHADTISIPCSYQSYLCPVQSHRLYSQLLMDRRVNESPYEYGYVVHVRNAYLIDDPQPVFRFEHKDLTKPPSERNNNRSQYLTFKPKLSSVCHGFVGYFDCCLYQDISLSIVPTTQNDDMYSWFPLFFPISHPFNVGEQDTIELHITRNTDSVHVWYEWTVLNPVQTKIHNLNGKYYSIGLH